MQSTKIINLLYLCHQWSDEANILQSCSTGEYFETVEYEPQRPLGYRDSLWFGSDLELEPTWDSGSECEFFSDFARIFNFRWFVLHHNPSESLRSFSTYWFHVYTLWENLQEVDLTRLESRKYKNWKKVRIFAEMGGRPTWRAWKVLGFSTWFLIMISSKTSWKVLHLSCHILPPLQFPRPPPLVGGGSLTRGGKNLGGHGFP